MGIFKNTMELEENLNLEEVKTMVEAIRDREHRKNKFLAMLKGIDLDEGEQESPEEKFRKAEQRVKAQLEGKNLEEIEFEDLGIDLDTE